MVWRSAQSLSPPKIKAAESAANLPPFHSTEKVIEIDHLESSEAARLDREFLALGVSCNLSLFPTSPLTPIISPMRNFLIDTDTASDDAVALIMALRYDDVRVEAITVVSGNVPVDQGLKNALYTTELCGADVPVYRGEAGPLKREAEYAQYYHGEDGLGDQGYPDPKGSAQPHHAVDAMIDTVRRFPGLTLVTLGPLTNVALAVQRDPETMATVGRCVVMGGAACTVGNVSPAAEFNIWVDPDAAKIVFDSAIPIEMVGWELSRHEANILAQDIEDIRAIDTPLAHFAIDCNDTVLKANLNETAGAGISLPDPVAMAIALDPTICTRKSAHFVDIETSSELTRGMTVVDQINVAGRDRNHAAWGKKVLSGRKTTVCWELDVAAFKSLLRKSLT